MAIISVPATGATVRLPRTPVNRLVTVDAGAGDRLRAFIESRWTRKNGGMRAFCKAIGVTPETAYGWFRGDNDPSLGALAHAAKVLGAKRYEIVAAMDGEGPVGPVNEDVRRLIREEIERAFRERD